MCGGMQPTELGCGTRRRATIRSGAKPSASLSPEQNIDIPHNRAMVKAVLDGLLMDVPVTKDAVFGLEVPVSCPGVPDEVLRPRDCWADKAAYDAPAANLAVMFHDDFKKYSGEVPENIGARWSIQLRLMIAARETRKKGGQLNRFSIWPRPRRRRSRRRSGCCDASSARS